MQQNGGAGDGNKQPQIDDAKHFLEKVKEAFQNKSGVYDRFVEIMKNFKHDRLNTGGVIKEVEELFGGHNELFIGFQNFLPNSGLLNEEEVAQLREDMARNQNQRNMNNNNNGAHSHSHSHSHNNGNSHNSHTNLSNNPPNQPIITSVAVAPNTNVVPSTVTPGAMDANNPPDFNMAVTFICKIKQRFGAHRKIYNEFLAILQHFQTAAQANDTTVIRDVKLRIRALFREHPDLLEQFDYFLPPLTAHFRGQGQQQQSSADSSSRVNGHKRPAPHALVNPHPSKRQRQNDEGDRRSRKRRKQIKNEISDSGGAHSDDDDPDWTADGHHINIDGRDRIKTRSSRRNREKEKKRRREKKRIKEDSAANANSTANNHNNSHSQQQQQSGNNGNNGNNNNNGGDSDDEDISSDDDDMNEQDSHQGLRIFSRLRKDIPDSLYKHVLTLTQLYPMGLTEFNVVGKLICDALREHGFEDLMKDFQKELQSSKQSWFFRSRGQNYYEYLTNNVLLKSCKAVQSSYRQLPQDVIQPRCSGRHPDALRVLNDYFVSKPTGGEGSSDNPNAAGGRLKNQYSENLQKSEDDLFELDMMIETNNAARQRLEQLYKTVMAPKNIKQIQSPSSMEIPPVEKRAISRLYSEHGNKVLTLLKKMPETTIPVVLKRLREKSQEWIDLKNEMKTTWKAVADKNYFKAHDYRFTIFKSADLKKMGMKNLVKQCEERHNNKHHHSQQQQSQSHISDDDEDDDDDIKIKQNGHGKEEADDDDDDIDIDLKQQIKSTSPPPKPDLKYDTIHHSDNRQIDIVELDSFDTYIASGSHINTATNGVGVINGVGLIGNASHDYIIKKMGAGLHVELGNYVENTNKRGNGNGDECEDEDNDISMHNDDDKNKTKNNNKSVVNHCDFRFVVYNRDILKDCMRFVFQYAKKQLPRNQRQLFGEILEVIFREFFNMDIKNQINDCLAQKDDSSDEESPSPGSMATSPSIEPMSLILRSQDKQDENALNNICINEEDEQINNYLDQYYDSNRESVVLYGSKPFYGLMRYIQCLYARMHYAFTLCSHNRGLYKLPETEQETIKKYQDFLSNLSNLINGHIDNEKYEDECRKLLGIKAYQLFTIDKIIEHIYRRTCDLDTDSTGLSHDLLKLFLWTRNKLKSNKQKQKELRSKYFVYASQLAQNKNTHLFRMEYFENRILTISWVDAYQQETNENDDNADNNKNKSDADKTNNKNDNSDNNNNSNINTATNGSNSTS